MVKIMWLIHEKWILQYLSALELQKKNPGCAEIPEVNQVLLLIH